MNGATCSANTAPDRRVIENKTRLRPEHDLPPG